MPGRGEGVGLRPIPGAVPVRPDWLGLGHMLVSGVRRGWAPPEPHKPRVKKGY